MMEQTVMLGKRKFVLLPESDFRRLQAKAAERAAPFKVMPKAGRKPRRTLKQTDAWMSAHWEEIVTKAKSNTKKLTGREVL